MSASLALAGGCKKVLSSEGVTWLGAVERQLDHGVNLAIGVCKPDRSDATAWQAQATSSGNRALLDDLLACAANGDCTKPTAGAKAAEAQLDEEARKYAVSSREALSSLLSAATTTKKTRAQASTVLTDAVATADASSKLVRICGSPARQYDMPHALLEVEQARARFRSSIKTMRADP